MSPNLYDAFSAFTYEGENFAFTLLGNTFFGVFCCRCLLFQILAKVAAPFGTCRTFNAPFYAAFLSLDGANNISHAKKGDSGANTAVVLLEGPPYYCSAFYRSINQ